MFVAVDVIGFILALWALTFRGVNSSFTPMVIVFGFTVLALIGIYYALQGERRWVV